MNKHLTLLTAALLLTSASSAFAASSTDLTVTGTITPAACTPTLSSNAIDLGKISSKDLKQTSATIIDRRTLTLSVNCDATTSFALVGVDGRPGSSIESIKYGLGFINTDQKLGGLGLYIRNPVADGVPVQTIGSFDGSTWYKESIWEPKIFIAVGSLTDDSQPISVKDLTADIDVSTVIARADRLDLTNEVPIDGQVTIEVRY
ncbi:DUF1120 domain-containing protein [Pseudomonas sp. 14P_8.1_Bac3]|uniref:DUF1120 domain-containing protein n=1 Tax=Pseudomonas sp. 14P_8.1_Bac3 TaxID=2971621 RepID=UPI0021C95F81|nr:DUF1120 domain-containing protein [Pseudomonas sp. 14P_8.1_Bac3]MCU1760552.1 DUF1120 domain-containing protein [Pseudomonas sp. 14P_8.1_Bac3]